MQQPSDKIEQTSFRAWLAKQKEIYPLTEKQLNDIFTWSTKHGSGNGWTGTSGTAALYIRMLLLERKWLVDHAERQ